MAKKVQRELFREVHCPAGRVRVTSSIRKRSVKLLKLRGTCSTVVAAERTGVSPSMVSLVWRGRRDPGAPARDVTLHLIGPVAGLDWRPATVIDDALWRRVVPGNEPGVGLTAGSIVEKFAARGVAVVFRPC